MRELTVAVSHPNELFEPAAADVPRGLPPGVAGIERIDGELRTLHREGRQTALIGILVLVVSLVASKAILSSGEPRTIKDFLGNGLFLAAAWVGLWWPLEIFIYSGRPFGHERRLLRAMASMEIHVRPTGTG